MNLFDALKQYLSDAAPGGSLNPEVTPQGLLDVAAMASTPVPVVGDVLGLAADAKRLYDNPSERTAMNYGMSALGLLPFVPAGMTKLTNSADALRGPQAEALETARKNAVEMLGQSKANSPMDRAADLGFTTPAYHATAKNFEAFRPGGYDPSISGHAVWVSPYADVQPAMHNVGARGGKYREGANVMPLMVKSKAPLMLDDKSMLEWAQDVYAGGSKDFPQTVSKEAADALIADGYDSIKFMGEKLGWGPKSDEIVMLNPKNIRSRFAAFDPARVNENDLLGRADPRLLGLMGVLGAGGIGGAYLYNQDKK